MFKKVDIPVSRLPEGILHPDLSHMATLVPKSHSPTSFIQLLGMVQNMSVFTCPNCRHATHIFGADGVERECKKHGIELLGDVPLHASICQDADRGKPTVVSDPTGVHALAFEGIAEKVSRKIFG